MGSIYMGIGNIVIVKTSLFSYSSARAAGKEDCIDIWESIGEERIREERRGEDT